MPQLGLTNQLPQMTHDVVCVLYFEKGTLRACTIDVWNHRPRDGGGVRTASPNEVTRNFLHRIVTLTYVTVILT